MSAAEQTPIETAADGSFQPLLLRYETVRQFSSQKLLFRSSLVIQSMELGTLEQEQYRYVARRTVQSEQLFGRHLHKVVEALPELLKENPRLDAVSIPVYNRMLKKSSLAGAIFKELSAHPGVSASNLMVEVSADILYEELEPLQQELERVRNMGVRVAIWELGDPFCPLLRLRELSYDYLILDSWAVNLLAYEHTEDFESLCRFLHTREKTRIIAPGISDVSLLESAEKLGCDGYTLTPEADLPPEEEDEL